MWDILKQNSGPWTEKGDRRERVRKKMDTADLTTSPMANDPPQSLLNGYELTPEARAVLTSSKGERAGRQTPLARSDDARPTPARGPRHRTISPDVNVSRRKIRKRHVENARLEKRGVRSGTGEIKITSEGKAGEATPRRKRSNKTEIRPGQGGVKSRMSGTETAPRGGALQPLPRLGFGNTGNGERWRKTKSSLIEGESGKAKIKKERRKTGLSVERGKGGGRKTS